MLKIVTCSLQLDLSFQGNQLLIERLYQLKFGFIEITVISCLEITDKNQYRLN